MQTIGNKLSENNGFGPGFDFLRIALALGVLIWHTVALSTNSASDVLNSVLWPAVYAILPMFFALSGFLVTGSALRLPLREYILNRTFRIVPALGVDIFFCALIIGPIFTVVAYSEYFSSQEFFLYFGNILGWIHYELPGVFLDNPYPDIVNGALWTVPYEIACYVVMSFMIWLGLIKRPLWVLGCAAFIIATAITLSLVGDFSGKSYLDKAVRFAFLSKGASLVPAFLVGSGIYLLKDKVPHSALLAGLIVLSMAMLGVFADPALFYSPIFIGLSTAPLAYLVVWAGMEKIPNLPMLKKGDYSYGIYLYHFPILQVIQSIFGFNSWVTLSLVGIPIVTLFAMFSWHAIEKPVLKSRRKYSLVGARLAAEKG